jgi:glycosyltransferase involved in cell wall biosynthesis
MSKTIVVNATAPRSGGALTILQQFVEAAPADGYRYVVFIHPSVRFAHTPPPNVQLVEVSKTSYLRRFLWDALGLKRWLRKNGIRPAAAVSLQNTGFRTGARCPCYIYYHTPVALFPHRWSCFKKEERLLWFYLYIYPWFVRLFLNRRTEIFVQLAWIKESFCRLYRFPAEKVHVVRPDTAPPAATEEPVEIDTRIVNLFYPAYAYPYKNHRMLNRAFEIIDRQLPCKVALYLSNFSNFSNFKIYPLGSIPYGQVLWLYRHATALVFPSFIETFGLPLTEAASFGLPVIAADLPYAREVLKGYEGATFVPYNDPEAWGKAILKLCAEPDKKYPPLKQECIAPSWDTFFDIVKRGINNR